MLRYSNRLYHVNLDVPMIPRWKSDIFWILESSARIGGGKNTKIKNILNPYYFIYFIPFFIFLFYTGIFYTFFSLHRWFFSLTTELNTSCIFIIDEA